MQAHVVVGMLSRLFDADRASLLVRLILDTVTTFDIDVSLGWRVGPDDPPGERPWQAVADRDGQQASAGPDRP